jgi:DNA-binding XRE family transcriptional regulator
LDPRDADQLSKPDAGELPLADGLVGELAADAKHCRSLLDRDGFCFGLLFHAMQGYFGGGRTPDRQKPLVCRDFRPSGDRACNSTATLLSVATDLRRLRQRAELTQGELARRAGVSRATINRHERAGTPAAVKQALDIVAALRDAEFMDLPARADATVEGVYGERPKGKRRRRRYAS